jgi:hypothetical protein
MDGKQLKVDQLNKIIEAKIVIIGNAGMNTFLIHRSWKNLHSSQIL